MTWHVPLASWIPSILQWIPLLHQIPLSSRELSIQMFLPDFSRVMIFLQTHFPMTGVHSRLDLSPARGLKESGLFIVRSRGGIPNTAVALSNIILDRRATVVVHDYCFSACAMFFLLAAHQSFVLKGALVAWHYPQSGDPTNPFCTYVIEPRDGKAKKLQRGSCEAGGEKGVKLSPEMARFFEERVIDRPFDYPPDSLYVRRTLRNLYGDTGVFRDVLWTLHPR